MKRLQKTKIGEEEGFFTLLRKFAKNGEPITQADEPEDVREFIRVYVELPLELIIALPNGEKEAFKGRALNLSEEGILISSKVQVKSWQKLENQLEAARILGRFTAPEEIAGGFIGGEIRHCTNRISDENDYVDLEMGVKNISISQPDRVRILRFINTYIMSGINDDLLLMEKIKSSRDLTAMEANMYEYLLQERSTRMKTLGNKLKRI